jgi:hypothetical protein
MLITSGPSTNRRRQSDHVMRRQVRDPRRRHTLQARRHHNTTPRSQSPKKPSEMATETDAAPPAAQPRSQPPDSPPLPSKHTATTPGPRAARLQELFASTMTHTLNKVSWENFASCYPTIAANAPGTLKAVQRQMVERLRELCNVSELWCFLERANGASTSRKLELNIWHLYCAAMSRS